MSKRQNPTSPNVEKLREVARSVLDQEEARKLLKISTGEPPTAEAIKGFRYTFSEKAAKIVATAREHSRRRGREITGEDIGRVIEQSASKPIHSKFTPPPGSNPWIPGPGAPGPDIPNPIQPPQQELRKCAQQAINESEVEKLLSVVQKSPPKQAVEGLRQTLIEEAINLAILSSIRANRRGRSATGEDVGAAAESAVSPQRRIKPPGAGGSGGSSGESGKSGDGSSDNGSSDDGDTDSGPGSGGGDYIEPPRGGGSDDSSGNGGNGGKGDNTGNDGQKQKDSRQGPTASIYVEPANPEPQESVTFDGRSSSDPDGNITEYQWKVERRGERSATVATSTSAKFVGSLPTTGGYQVELQVKDDDGLTDTATKYINASYPPAFIAGVYFPTWVDNRAVPMQASDCGQSRKAAFADAAIMSPKSKTGLSRDEYEITVPIVFVWNTNVAQSELGNLTLDFRVYGDGYSARKQLDITQTSGKKSRNVVLRYNTIDNPTQVYFRKAQAEVVAKFGGSTELAQAAPTQKIMSNNRYVTPNNSLLGTAQLLNTTSTVYNRGVDAADKVTRFDLNRLRNVARVLMYAQAAHTDLITKSDLVQDAAINGISAFQNEISDGIDAIPNLQCSPRIAMTGPTVAFER